MNFLIEFSEYIFDRLQQTAAELTPEALEWRPMEEANNIKWILVHTTRIANILIPQVLTGTHNPNGWDDDYEQRDHSLDDLRNDINVARTRVINLLGELDDMQLEEKIFIWGSERSLREPLIVLLGELFHHNGQIAMLMGIRKRVNQKA